MVVVVAAVGLIVVSLVLWRAKRGSRERTAIATRTERALVFSEDDVRIRMSTFGIGGCYATDLNGDVRITSQEAYVMLSSGVMVTPRVLHPCFRLMFGPDAVPAARAPGTLLRVTSVTQTTRGVVIEADAPWVTRTLRLTPRDPDGMLEALEVITRITQTPSAHGFSRRLVIKRVHAAAGRRDRHDASPPST